MIKKYTESLEKLHVKNKYSKEDLLTKDFLIKADEDIEIYWAPFDYINTSAKVVLLGITPGWTQMQESFSYLCNNLKCYDTNELSEKCKSTASFSGPMRKNLTSMLNDIELNSFLNIDDCNQLFDDKSHLVHYTSVLRYPVFKNNKNYTGSNPSILKNDMLKQMVDTILGEEFNSIPTDAIIVPMGKAVSQVLEYLIAENKIKQRNILFNFPHPSGANAHRVTQFKENKDTFINIIKNIQQ